MIDHDQLVQTLAGSLGGGGLLAYILRFLLELRRERAASRHTQGLEDQVEVYAILNRLLDSVGAVRAAIIRSKNGGGIPRPDKPVYISRLHQVYTPKHGDDYRSWDGLLADETSSKVLLELVKEGQAHVRLADLPPASDISLHMQAVGSKQRLYRILHLSGTEGIFLEVGLDTEDELTPGQEYEVRLAARELRRILERYRGPSISIA